MSTSSQRPAGAPEVASDDVKKTQPGLFIDHGDPLPEDYPGEQFQALIRDPGTLFVYWSDVVDSPRGWVVSAVDAHGHTLLSLRVPHGSRRAYLHLDAARVRAVRLRPIAPSEDHELAALLPASPSPPRGERWGQQGPLLASDPAHPSEAPQGAPEAPLAPPGEVTLVLASPPQGATDGEPWRDPEADEAPLPGSHRETTG